jgi:hypothetical protein
MWYCRRLGLEHRVKRDFQMSVTATPDGPQVLLLGIEVATFRCTMNIKVKSPSV